MPIIRVKKTFVYSRPPKEGEKLAAEKTFHPGEHEVDEEMASHPWIREHYADGCIESPAEAAARAAETKAAAEKAAIEAAQVQALADAALARMATGAAGTTATKEEIEAELNTPVAKLRRTTSK
jgi:hypothetical protein